MKSCRTICFCLIACLQVVVFVAPALAAKVADLPTLTSYHSDPFTAEEQDAVFAWILDHPKVQALIGDDRTRVLRGGSDYPKGPDGPFRRATMFVRNYDQGLTHEITVNLDSGELQHRNDHGLIQANRAEIDAGMAIILADEGLQHYANDPDHVLNGAFFLRSPYEDDPCSRNICLIYHFVDTKSTVSRSSQRVLVDLTRQEIADGRYNFSAVWDSEYVKSSATEGN
ncbi:MAG: hypothetical protein AAF604_21590 [Acidobacteriota bacterium]